MTTTHSQPLTDSSADTKQPDTASATVRSAASAKRQNNGLRLSKDLLLPTAIEFQVISCLDWAEFGCVLLTSRDMRALTENYFSNCHEVIVNADANKNFFYAAANALLKRAKSLRTLKFADCEFDSASTRSGLWLARLITANRETLQRIHLEFAAVYFGAASMLALAKCPNLREIASLQPAFSHTQPQLFEPLFLRLIKSCKMLDSMDMCLESDTPLSLSAITTALTSGCLNSGLFSDFGVTGLPLKKLDVKEPSLDIIRAIANPSNRKLEDLKIRLNDDAPSDEIASEMFERIAEQVALLPCLTNFEILGDPWETKEEIPAVALKLPSVTNLKLPGKFQLFDKIDAPKLLKFEVNGKMSEPNTELIANLVKGLESNAWPNMIEFNGRFTSNDKLCLAAPRWSKLQVLNLAVNSAVNPQVVGDLLEQMPQLEKLFIMFDDFDPWTNKAGPSDEKASKPMELKRLQKMDIDVADNALFNRFTFSALSSLILSAAGVCINSALFANALLKMPSLTELSFRNAPNINFELPESATLPIRYLVLQNNGLTLEQNMSILAASAPTLRSLDLCDEKATKLLFVLLPSLRFPELATLKLLPGKTSTIDSVSLVLLIDNCPKLTSLKLPHYCQPDSELKSLCKPRAANAPLRVWVGGSQIEAADDS